MTGARLAARIALVAALQLASVLVAGSVPATARASAVDAPFTDAAGIHVVSAVQSDDRLWKLSVSSAALGRAVRLRVLLPSGYRDHPSERYPVLYLFHGTSGGPDDWLTAGEAEATTSGLPLVVVLPDAGFDNDGGGWFTDWVNQQTVLGPSQWETFHVGQLIPWVDANIRTVAERSGRAIAGLSQGGFGAMSYAARHPDMFAAAASFSGAPDIDRDPVVIPFSTAVIEATATFLDGVPAGSMFGPRLTNEINWQAHDPTTLLTNLRSTALFEWTATGLPGQLDSGAPNPAAMTIEAITHLSTALFHQHLVQAGIPDQYHDYVFGTHTFPYWARDLREFVGPLMDVFAHPAAPPAVVSYRSTAPSWTQWGWTVALSRSAPQAFTDLSAASSAGFTLTGFGTATVVPPDLFAVGTTRQVTVRSGGVDRTTTVKAGSDGHLHIAVPLTGMVSLVPGRTTVTVR